MVVTLALFWYLGGAFWAQHTARLFAAVLANFLEVLGPVLARHLT